MFCLQVFPNIINTFPSEFRGPWSNSKAWLLFPLERLPVLTVICKLSLRTALELNILVQQATKSPPGLGRPWGYDTCMLYFHGIQGSRTSDWKFLQRFFFNYLITKHMVLGTAASQTCSACQQLSAKGLKVIQVKHENQDNYKALSTRPLSLCLTAQQAIRMARVSTGSQVRGCKVSFIFKIQNCKLSVAVHLESQHLEK